MKDAEKFNDDMLDTTSGKTVGEAINDPDGVADHSGLRVEGEPLPIAAAQPEAPLEAPESVKDLEKWEHEHLFNNEISRDTELHNKIMRHIHAAKTLLRTKNAKEA